MNQIVAPTDDQSDIVSQAFTSVEHSVDAQGVEYVMASDELGQVQQMEEEQVNQSKL